MGKTAKTAKNGLVRAMPMVLVVWSVALGVVIWLSPHVDAGNPEASVEVQSPGSLADGGLERSAGLAQGVGSASQADGGAYVGEAVCLTCHEGTTYVQTAHGRRGDPQTPAATQGCESCHGPGEAHVNAGGDPDHIKHFAAMTAREVTDTCTTCHNRGEQAMWEGSPHESRDISCAACHSVHEPQSPEHDLVRTTEIEACGGCHRDKVMKLDRSGHMPVREGKMQCSSCHNPHGSQNVRLLRVGMTVSDACTSCHADKRGPFLWEHAPVRENCASCHDPHGSSNERMLVAKSPMLCQRCHAHTRHPSTIYDNRVVETSNRLYARSCVTCHSNIHGSNHASGNTFLR